MRLRKLAIDGEKTLQGVAELAYQQSFQLWCFQRLSTALTTARTYLWFIGAPESERLPWGYRVPRAIELVYQAGYVGEVRHRDARSPEAVPRSRFTTRRPAPRRALV